MVGRGRVSEVDSDSSQSRDKKSGGTRNDEGYTLIELQVTAANIEISTDILYISLL